MKQIRSSAFRDGFVQGFSAPFAFFHVRKPITVPAENLVVRSWATVGTAMHAAMTQAGVQNDPASVKREKRRARDHAS